MLLIENNKNSHKTNIIEEVRAGKTGYGLLIERDGHIEGNSNIINQIREDISNQHKFVIPDKFIVSAVFQKYDVKNANGRIYPKDILMREVERYINECVDTRSAVGSLDHPESSTLSGKDVSHNIINLEWSGKTLIGELELHLSPGYRKYGIPGTSGDLAANLILDGIQIGVSSRALGSVEDRFGSLIVGDDLELLCWDIVLNPSTSGSFIAMNRSDLEPYIESKTSHKPQINEKISEINKILFG